MSDAVEKAKKFLNEERAFRLGELLTESSHPKTRNLSEAAQADLPAAVRLLQSVDEEIPPVVSTVLEQDVFRQLIAALVAALSAGKRVFFTGCGATGRLSILLEAAWRQFWQGFEREFGDVAARIGEMEDSVISIMAGGDFALIKSVEGFEDFPDFGRYQLKEAGVRSGDVVIAITEGGETPFVIGTAWEGLDTGAEVFFVYNNPTQLMRGRVLRSCEVIEEPRIRKLDLTTGPMAITGSTRMQAVTAELLVVGAALENALIELLEIALPTSQRKSLIEHLRPAEDYHRTLVRLLDQISLPSAVVSMVREIEFEEAIYRQHGLITYAADSCLLDVLTDTTERSPTFMVPAFRQHGDTRSAKPWAFVKNPFLGSEDAWRDMLWRQPRGLRWGPAVYKKLKSPPQLQSRPPRLDNNEIHKFRIGNEPDPSRTDAADSALVAIAAEQEANRLIKKALDRFGSDYKKTAVMTIGASAITSGMGETFELVCDLPCSPLRLWHHLAVKLILNTISTATMVRMGRVVGNAMVWLSPSNKKLIDRGSRLISQVTGYSYERACIVLHQAMEEVGSRLKQAEEVPSPVALAIERIQAERAKPL